MRYNEAMSDGKNTAVCSFYAWMMKMQLTSSSDIQGSCWVE